MITRLCFFFLAVLSATAGQKFYSDDPLEREPAPRNVTKAENRKLSDYYDLFSHQFATPGQLQPKKGAPIRAQGVNTLGEPLQGAWWVKRHYYQRMSLDQLRRGPSANTPPATGAWTITSAKNEGITPGFVIVDQNKRTFFVKFDPLTNPEMASAADAITGHFFYALGYHVPDNYITHFRREQLVLAKDITIANEVGKKRKMTEKDLDMILSKVPRRPDGSYRATASLALPGKPVGPPRYYGTRADDPNDTVPHEHRRDLRGLNVIDAWIAHDDSRAINNIDILLKEGNVQYLRHYQLDFGSTLGSGTARPNSPRSGVYFFDWKQSAAQLFSLGFYIPYWAKARYPHFQSIGLFESKVFDPEKWVPEYPNPAFLNRLPDDEFWGAKLITAFSDDDIRAIVETGLLSDSKAAAWLAQCLIERRDKIGKVYFAKLLPYDRFRIENNTLAWDDLGAVTKLLPPVQSDIQWAAFDNNSATKTPIPGASSSAIPNRDGILCATLTSRSKKSHTIEVYLRRSPQQTTIIGVDRSW